MINFLIMLKQLLKSYSNLNNAKDTIKLAITGAKGNISYSLLFWIANGDIFGKEQKIELSLIDLPGNQNALEGVKMEL
jgi:malate dehydrogenase